MPKIIESFLSIFKSSVSGGYDMGRVLAFKTMTTFSAMFIYTTLKNPHIPVNWVEVGGGYAAVMAGCVAFIGGKEYALAKANSLGGGRPGCDPQ